MVKYTLVFEFAGQPPRIGPNSTFEGGRCVAVQFSDALKEIEHLEDRVEYLESLLDKNGIELGGKL